MRIYRRVAGGTVKGETDGAKLWQAKLWQATLWRATLMRPAAFITHPSFMAPGFGRHHPLSSGRQGAVVDLVRALGWLAHGCEQIAPLPTLDGLTQFHDAGYLAALERVSVDRLATPDDRARFNLGSMECPVFEGLWERARASVGGAILAADLTCDGLVAFHPAGGTHHGRPDRASGFCYLNDPVFAIRRLLARGVGRVAYIDLDAHHGDGVEDAFRDNAAVCSLSIHEAGRWPGTGPTGTSADGRIVNVATPRGIGDDGYRRLADRILLTALDRWSPDAVVVTLGADGLAGDPLSAMGLSSGLLWSVTEQCIAAAPRAVILGGGGYNPWTTARLWAGQWGRLIGAAIPAALPETARVRLAALDSDLIDAEDRPGHWLTALVDPPTTGAVPPSIIDALIDAALRPPV